MTAVRLLTHRGVDWLRDALPWLGRALLLGLPLALMGLLIGWAGFLGWLLVILPVLGLSAVVAAQVWRLSLRQLGLVGLLALYLVLPLFFKLIGANLVNWWQFLALGLALFGLPGFARWAARERLMRASLLCWAGFVLLLVLSSVVAGQSKQKAALYQLFSDAKPVWLLALGFAVYGLKRPGAPLWALLRWACLPLWLLCLWQWGHESSYMAVFKFMPALGADLFGVLPSQAFSAFEHPASMAGFVAPAALLCGLHATVLPQRRRQYLLWALLYLGLLVASGERGELGALLLAAMGVFVLQQRERWLGRLLALLPLGALLLGLYWLAHGEGLIKEAAMWGGSSHAAIEHPRAQLYGGAMLLAEREFPLGNGMGTYGGAGASKFDQSTYLRLGFAQLWWFRGENFLLDIYWHNSIGEAGWFGFGLLLLHYLLLGLLALRKHVRSEGLARVYWGGAGFGLVYLLINSVASPAFQDPRLYVWSAICWGLAVLAERDKEGDDARA